MAATHRHQFTVNAEDIEPGDRTTKNGKTRYVQKHVFGGRVHWRVQTTGARSATVVAFEPGERVKVWRTVPTFNSVTYSQNGEYLLRTVETLTEPLYVDGGVFPQQVIASHTSEVYEVDPDFQEARRYVADVAEGDRLASIGA